MPSANHHRFEKKSTDAAGRGVDTTRYYKYGSMDPLLMALHLLTGAMEIALLAVKSIQYVHIKIISQVVM